MLRVTEKGLFCEGGNFFVDPWGPVERAVVTHAHSDHACPGCASYLCSEECRGVLRARVGSEPAIESADWNQAVSLGGVRVSFHPAGHILGSAQIRIESGGEVWVVSGDYKLEPDPTCRAFEPVRCDTFITESTFGLPIYRWRPQAEIFAEIHAWWRGNQQAGKASVLFAYPLGKAQRVLAGLIPMVEGDAGPIRCHGSVENMNRLYREAGVALPPTGRASVEKKGFDWSKALILAPPLANNRVYLRGFGPVSTAFASGWMRIRGTRRRKSIDRGFILSDHADWPSLLRAIDASEAQRVLVTHGYRAPVVRWLREKGVEADSLDTRYEGEVEGNSTESGEELEDGAAQD